MVARGLSLLCAQGLLVLRTGTGVMGSDPGHRALNDQVTAIQKIMNHNQTINEAITINQVADYFGVSVRTIMNWMKRDEDFPQRFKRFRTLRFRKSEIEAYWVKNSKDRII